MADKSQGAGFRSTRGSLRIVTAAVGMASAVAVLVAAGTGTAAAATLSPVSLAVVHSDVMAAPAIDLPIPPAPPVPPASALTGPDKSFLALLNAQRKDGGLVPLQEVVGLDAVSGGSSDNQAAQGRYASLIANPNLSAQVKASGASTMTMTGQSVAKWYPQSVKAVDAFALYVGYPDARSKMMNPSFRYVGIHTLVTPEGLSYASLTYSDQADPQGVVDPAAVYIPTGALTTATETGSIVRLQGRASDLDAVSPLQITVTDTVGTATTSQSLTATTGAFDSTIGISGFGSHQICLTVKNQGAGADLPLGCTVAQVGAVVGTTESMTTGRESARLTGWVIDPDSPASPVSVAVVSRTNSGDTVLSTVGADLVRSDVAQSYPGTGTAHGFSVSVSVPMGSANICAVATAARTGQVAQLGCLQGDVLGRIIGSHDTLRQSGTQLQTTGWGFDQDTPATALTAVVTTSGPGGSATTTVMANSSRPDAGRAFPGIGNNHGYSVVVPARGHGINTVCVTLLPVAGSAPPMAYRCLTITVP